MRAVGLDPAGADGGEQPGDGDGGAAADGGGSGGKSGKGGGKRKRGKQVVEDSSEDGAPGGLRACRGCGGTPSQGVG